LIHLTIKNYYLYGPVVGKIVFRQIFSTISTSFVVFTADENSKTVNAPHNQPKKYCEKHVGNQEKREKKNKNYYELACPDNKGITSNYDTQ
jgi:hypothetical protein